MSANIHVDQNSVTTLLAIENQLTAACGIDLTYRPETTINYKRGILASYKPEVVPRIRYFGIGIKGFANLTSENNISQPYMPSATDCDLYEPIPFRCTPTPLQGEEAAQYVMRDTTTIDGTTYFRYWLKKIEFESSTVRLTKVNQETRIEEAFTYDTTSLTPVPVDIMPTDINTVKERIVASVTGICRVTGKEVTEVINAMYGGDMRRARISEIGTYSGVPKKVEESSDGLPAAEEAIYVQLATHKCMTGHSLADPSAYFVARKVFENGSSIIL